MLQRKTTQLALEAHPLEPHSHCSPHELDPKDSSKGTCRREEYRRVLVRGTYLHEAEVLVGPRGPPLGVMGSVGPLSGRSSGGMSSSPQGYFVITPLVRTDNLGTVLVNRGWVPRQAVKPQPHTQPSTNLWDRPMGIVDVVGVPSKTERPTFISPPHDAKNPRHLLWMDRPVMEDKTHTAGLSPLLITEVTEETTPKDNEVWNFPVKPSKKTAGEFRVMPMTHLGYTATWFSLSGMGMIMTRRLIMRGRG